MANLTYANITCKKVDIHYIEAGLPLNATNYYNITCSAYNCSLPSSTPPPTHYTEGGIFNGVGPLESDLSLFFVQLLVIQVLSKLIALPLNKYLHEPKVIAEIIAGIILGPSVMGRIPGFTETLFPDSRKRMLKLFADTGMVFFVFLVGLELDINLLKSKAKKSLFISLAGIAVPFLFGCGVGVYFYTFLPVSTSNPPAIGLVMIFIAVSMSITAFPFVARILNDFNLLDTVIGATSISAGAVDDATSWILLALVVALVNSAQALSALYILLVMVAYVIIMLFGVRWALQMMYAKKKWLNRSNMVLLSLCLTLLSAYFTEIIGIHSIFGGFVAGLTIPRDNNFSVHLIERIEDVVMVLLLPLFFTFSGLKTDLSLLDSGIAWGGVFLAIGGAMIGKILGCSITSRLFGISWRDSFAIGILMTTKGLIEIIVLFIGLQAGIIPQVVFTIMVVMALVTTFIAPPVIRKMYPPSDVVSLESKELGFETKLNLLLCVPSQASISTHISLLQAILGNLVPSESDDDHPVTSIASCRVLRLFEIDDSLAGPQKASTLKHAKDPSIEILKNYARMYNVAVEADVSCVETETMDKELGRVANENAVNAIILPWQTEEQEDGEVCNRTQLVERTLAHCKSTNVVIPVQRIDESEYELDVIKDASKTVLVIFIGGPDDRAALHYSLKVSNNSNVKLHILQLVIEDNEVKEVAPQKIDENYDMYDPIVNADEDTTLIDMVCSFSNYKQKDGDKKIKSTIVYKKRPTRLLNIKHSIDLELDEIDNPSVIAVGYHTSRLVSIKKDLSTEISRTLGPLANHLHSKTPLVAVVRSCTLDSPSHEDVL
eukprot:TRINITY_DN4761_c0_g1_i1.p1 TRINITY_DN4761_c0_g1~~TRINITY_DN4761_c0_g1_i1.p1  ORF type:complete len:832 (-),score=69.70 TRINITY_DN4761_c0_g1_i1:20-2515(-)